MLEIPASIDQHTMHTVNKPTEIPVERRRQERVPGPRHRGDYFSLVGLAVFFSLYLYLVNQMQGITFDTGFLALYCAALSVFILRSLLFAFHPDFQD
jgi:hypothetical protein